MTNISETHSFPGRITVVRQESIGSEFMDVWLDGSLFVECSIAARFIGTCLANCTFIKCDMRESDFRLANLSHARFVDCNLTGCRFYGATIDTIQLHNTTPGTLIRKAPDSESAAMTSNCRRILALIRTMTRSGLIPSYWPGAAMAPARLYAKCESDPTFAAALKVMGGNNVTRPELRNFMESQGIIPPKSNDILF